MPNGISDEMGIIRLFGGIHIRLPEGTPRENGDPVLATQDEPVKVKGD